MASAGHTVLVVEDDPPVRELVVEALSQRGFAIIEAASGDEALAALTAHPEIAVVFSDVTMPGRLDGCGLAREVHARRPDIGVVLTSGKTLPENCALPKGGVFVPKPYSHTAIALLISRLLA